MITIKSKSEIEKMRAACKLTAAVHEELAKHIKPGVSTYELDKIAEDFIRSHGGIPAEKGYPSYQKGVPDFPGSICASINDEVIHGIPSKKIKLQDGDIVSLDVVACLKGYCADATRTFMVGTCKDNVKEIVKVCKDAF